MLLPRRWIVECSLSWRVRYKRLARLPPEQQSATLATLSPSAVLSYRHLNLHGEYDFSDQLPPAEAPFDTDLINYRLAAAKQTCIELSWRFPLFV